MKTINNLSKYFPVAILSLILLASTLGADAQNRHNEGKKGNDPNNKEYRKSDKKWKDGDRDNRNYESRNYRDDYRPKYSRKNSYAHHDYYAHPKYGRVYNRFDRNPIVFRHSHGDYYYSGNNFYRYNSGIGYCVVEPPRNVYFRHLPVECERVYINGNVFFRNSDLFFQRSPRGYAIVSSPIQVRISARF